VRFDICAINSVAKQFDVKDEAITSVYCKTKTLGLYYIINILWIMWSSIISYHSQRRECKHMTINKKIHLLIRAAKICIKYESY